MKPFLMNFASQRKDVGARYELRYNDTLDSNEIFQEAPNDETLTMLSQTITRVKVEKPDSLSLQNDQNDLFILLSATTTDVKRVEKPDVMGNDSFMNALSTNTYTKAKGEGSDKD